MEKYQYIFAKQLIEIDRIEENVYVEIENGYIKSISKELKKGLDITNVNILAPGLIDTHIHGNTGFDTMDGTYTSLNEMSKELASYGVTAFCPTTLTAPLEKIQKALEAVALAKEKGTQGAEILGAFIEGPYFNEKYKGAQPDEFFRKANKTEIDGFIKWSNGHISTIAIAPEKEGSLETIDYIVKKGIRVALGHTNSDYETCMKAVELGASVGVHTFNGMRGMHHREPGTVGAIFLEDRLYGELIGDGEHVHPQMIELMYRCKGVDKMILISDGMCATGMKDGNYKLGELDVVVENSVARTSYGSLAGSTLKLINAVFNIEKWTSANLQQSIQMASYTPAKSLKVDGEMGQIAVGKKANLIEIDNEQVMKTWVNGRLVFQREA